VKRGTPAAVRRAVGRWSHERIVRALMVVLESKGEMSLGELSKRVNVTPRQIVELTHYVLGPDPALGLQGHAFTPIFVGRPEGMRLRAGAGLGRALRRLSTVSASEAALALSGLRQLVGEGPDPLRPTLQGLARRLARTEAAQAAGADAPVGLSWGHWVLRQALEDALQAHQWISFRYRGAEGVRARRVLPRAIFTGPDGSSDYLEAWQDGPKAGVRRFRLSQVLRQSVKVGEEGHPFTPEQEAAFGQARMDSAFETAFEPSLVLARGRAAEALAQGALRARPWVGPPNAKAPAGWQAFALHYAQVPALVAALRAWIPDVKVAHPPRAASAWTAEVAALKRLLPK
jgi:predicted DNA-binding transcriptional regulator YafY